MNFKPVSNAANPSYRPSTDDQQPANLLANSTWQGYRVGAGNSLSNFAGRGLQNTNPASNSWDRNRSQQVQTTIMPMAQAAAPQDDVLSRVGKGRGVLLHFQERLSGMVDLDSESLGNFVYSPFSAVIPLSFFSLGTSGNTRKEFVQTMIPESMRSEFQNHDLSAGANGMAELCKQFGESGLMRTGTFIFSKKGSTFSEHFVQQVKSLMQTMNAGKDTEVNWDERDNLQSIEFIKEVNELVKIHTDNKIPKLLDENQPLWFDARLIALNTILLKAKWGHSLKTVELDFINSKQHIQKIPAVRYFACQYLRITCQSGAFWHVVWCPFENKDYGIILAMPHSGDAFHQAANRDRDLVSKCMAIPERARLCGCETAHAIFPKLKVESGLDISGLLQQGGFMNQAFNPNFADFSELSQKARTEKIHLSKVLQKAVLELDEHGVQAAAATFGGLFGCSTPKPIETIMYDRPFKLFIARRDGIPIFAVNIIDPPEQPQLHW